MNIKDIWKYLPIVSMFTYLDETKRESDRKIREILGDLIKDPIKISNLVAYDRKAEFTRSFKMMCHALYGTIPILYLMFASLYNTPNPIEMKKRMDQRIRDNQRIEQLVGQLRPKADTNGNGALDLNELTAVYQRANINPKVYIDAYGNNSFKVDLQELEKVVIYAEGKIK
ncbi:MAG TPA: hypothetical protein VJJ23_02125 [Candidatus Nanoarchaeia archaeon]|nr:hypothetical protein [Candidatus Nanoarchaeia archaeon]